MAPASPSHSLEIAPPEGTLLRLIYNMGLTRQIMEPFFSRYGLSSPQWGILRILRRSEEQGENALPQKEICRRMLMQPPSVTALVNRLERMSLVERGASDDLRVRMVELTPAGRQRIADVLEEHQAQVCALFSGLSSTDLETLHGLLGTLNSHLSVLANQSGASAKFFAGKSKVRPRSKRLPHTQ